MAPSGSNVIRYLFQSELTIIALSLNPVPMDENNLSGLDNKTHISSARTQICNKSFTVPRICGNSCTWGKYWYLMCLKLDLQCTCRCQLPHSTVQERQRTLGNFQTRTRLHTQRSNYDSKKRKIVQRLHELGDELLA